MECHRSFWRCSIEVTKSCSWCFRDYFNQLIWRISQFSQGFRYNSLWLRQKKRKIASTVWFDFFPSKNVGPNILLKRSIVGSGAVRRRPMLRGKRKRSVTSGKILLGDFWAEKPLWTSHLFGLQLLVPQVFGEWLKSVCVRHSKNSLLFRIYACWFRIWICVVSFPVSIAHVLSITHLVPDNIVHFVEKKARKNLPFFSLEPFLGGIFLPSLTALRPPKKKKNSGGWKIPTFFPGIASCKEGVSKSILERYFFPGISHRGPWKFQTSHGRFGAEDPGKASPFPPGTVTPKDRQV